MNEWPSYRRAYFCCFVGRVLCFTDQRFVEQINEETHKSVHKPRFFRVLSLVNFAFYSFNYCHSLTMTLNTFWGSIFFL